MNLAAAHKIACGKAASKPAIFWGDQRVTYGELLQQTEALAEHLQTTLGVFPGQRIGLWLQNCPQFVPALFAILSAGAVATPINNFLKPAEVSHIIEDAGIDLLLTDHSMSEAVTALRTDHP